VIVAVFWLVTVCAVILNVADICPRRTSTICCGKAAQFLAPENGSVLRASFQTRYRNGQVRLREHERAGFLRVVTQGNRKLHMRQNNQVIDKRKYEHDKKMGQSPDEAMAYAKRGNTNYNYHPIPNLLHAL
jgi:hypothetical protein